MMSVVKRRMMTAEYRELARQASALAAASPLDNVREKHEQAALQWTALAELNDRRDAGDAATAAVLEATAAARSLAEADAPGEL
jgi:hypothetical protein